MFDIDKYMHKPFFERECRPEPPCGFGPPPPHEKPRYTMTEEVEHTARLMRETIDRLLKFEERAKRELSDLSKNVMSDNVIFKNAMHESWTTFLMQVKNEINVFEANMESDVAMFKAEIESNYATLSEDVHNQIAENLATFEQKVADFEAKYEEEFTDLTSSIQEQYNTFVASVNQRIDNYNENTAQAFADFKRQMQTQLNTFEQTMEANYDNFTESVGNSFHEFRTNWEQIITARLAAQDAVISDAEMYMKTNLEHHVETLIGDMHANGDFADIIEGEVFNDLETTIRSFEALSVKYFGAMGDGVTDDTAAFALALSQMGVNYKALTIPEGTYMVQHVDFPDNSIVFASNATLKRSTHDGDTFVVVGKGSTLYGNLTVDGNKMLTDNDSEAGILFEEDCRSYGVITSIENTKHGFVVGVRNEHNHLVAHNNGQYGTANGDGSADGVYVVNGYDIVIRNITAYDNKRMGLTVTTFNSATNAPDADLMGRVYIANVYAHGNTYKDVDIEYANGVILENVETVTAIAASNSKNCTFRNCKTGGYYSTGGNDNVIDGFDISPVGSCNDVVYVDGDNNVVQNVKVLDKATAYTGNTVVIKGANHVQNVVVENGNNAFVCEGAIDCRSVRVDKGNNRLRTVNGITVPTNDFIIENGRLVVRFNATLNEGNVGDTIVNTAPVVTGEAGNKYFVEKWACFAADVWTECRTATAD